MKGVCLVGSDYLFDIVILGFIGIVYCLFVEKYLIIKGRFFLCYNYGVYEVVRKDDISFYVN